jgi:hypothetical protein
MVLSSKETVCAKNAAKQIKECEYTSYRE